MCPQFDSGFRHHQKLVVINRLQKVFRGGTSTHHIRFDTLKPLSLFTPPILIPRLVLKSKLHLEGEGVVPKNLSDRIISSLPARNSLAVRAFFTSNVNAQIKGCLEESFQKGLDMMCPRFLLSEA